MSKKKHKAQEQAGILIAVPGEDVWVLLDVLEQQLEDLYDEACDCDDCARTIVTLEDLVEKILVTAPVAR